MRSQRQVRHLCLVLGSLCLSGGAASAAPPELRLAPVPGGATVSLSDVRRGRPALLLFWRADCAPCLLELQHWPELRRAAGSMPLLLIGLQSRAKLAEGLARLPVHARSWVAQEDGAAVLNRFGKPPPRLPLAVALSSDGAICRVRHGLMGRNIVAQWRMACG